MFAWVTLLTQPSYLVGVKALHRSLQKSGTQWPLVVMVTSNVEQDVRDALVQDGCIVHPVEHLAPQAELTQHYALPQFGEVWNKLRIWGLTDYQRVVFLDADMLVLQNMDELFTLDFGDNTIAACHACRCNPRKLKSYPADWNPEHCHYTWQERGEQPPASLDLYLNGGFLVLEPDHAVLQMFEEKLAAINDLKKYPFAEQDFLNEVFSERWLPLPYIYNALKTLMFQHPKIWHQQEVKNIHYILEKPWKIDIEQSRQENDRYYPLDKLWWEIGGIKETDVGLK